MSVEQAFPQFATNDDLSPAKEGAVSDKAPQGMSDPRELAQQTPGQETTQSGSSSDPPKRTLPDQIEPTFQSSQAAPSAGDGQPRSTRGSGNSVHAPPKTVLSTGGSTYETPNETGLLIRETGSPTSVLDGVEKRNPGLLRITVREILSDGSTSSQVFTVNIEDVIENFQANTIFLSTDKDVSSSGAPGLSAWGEGEMLSFGQISSLDPAAGTTSGTFSSAFNLSDFAQDSNADIETLHYVANDITIGNTTTFDLLAGDVPFATHEPESLTSNNSLSTHRNDLIVFRPDKPGDYSQGTFTMLLENPSGKGLHAATLVEQDTLVGDVTLTKGSFLTAHTGGSEHHEIKIFTPDNVGAGNTTGTLEVLIDETSLLDGQVQGLGLIETTFDIGGTTLTAGNLLVSVKEGGTFGSNNLSATGHNVFALDIAATDKGSAASDFTAELVFDGSDVGLDTDDEMVFGVSLNTYFLEGTTGADSLTGNELDNLLSGLGGSDSLEGLGGDDVLVWDSSDSTIDGGTGSDTLSVNSGDVDFTSFSGSILGIESFDLTDDSGNNAVTLTAQDLLDVSDTDILSLLGDVGDSVDAGSGWSGGTVTGGFRVYTQGLATLNVDEDMTVNPDILT